MQADDYNQTSLATVIVAVMTSNLRLATMPGNAFLPAAATGLRRDSVVNVTALATLNKSELVEHVGLIAGHLLQEVDRGLRMVLALGSTVRP